jgi:hypothetical protein
VPETRRRNERNENMNINWLNTPLVEFWPDLVGGVHYSHGEGKAQKIMRNLLKDIERAYDVLTLEEDTQDGYRFCYEGQVLIIRDGHRRYEDLETLTLADLPAVLDTLKALEEEQRLLAK